MRGIGNDVTGGHLLLQFAHEAVVPGQLTHSAFLERLLAFEVEAIDGRRRAGHVCKTWF